MKRLIALAVLAAATAAYAKENPSDFTVDVHVKGSATGQDCRTGAATGRDFCHPTQTIKATIDGKTYVLKANLVFSKGVLPTGDYKARLLGKSTDTKNILKLKYEILLEDGSTRKFSVVGEEE